MQFQYLLFLIILSHTSAEVVRRKRDMLTIRNFIRCLFGLGYEEPITRIRRPNYNSIYGVPNIYYYPTDTPGYAITNLRNTISMNMLYPERLADGPYQIYREENSPFIHKNHFVPLVYEYNRGEPIYNLEQYKREPYVIEKSKVPITLNKYRPTYTANMDRETIKLDNKKEALPQPPSYIQNQFQHLVHGNTVFLPIRPGKIENFVVPERDFMNVRPNFGEVHVSKYPLERVSLTKPTSDDVTLEQKVTPYYFDNVNNFNYPVEHFTVKEPVNLDTMQTISQLAQTRIPNVKIPFYTLDNKVNNFKYPVERFSENEPVTIDKTDRFNRYILPSPESVALLPPNFGDVHVSKYPLRRISLTKPAGTDIKERFFQKVPSPVNMDDTMELTTVQTKAIMTNNGPDSVQKSVKFTEPVRSKFVYKNVFQSEPHKNTIFEFDNKQKSADVERESLIKTPLEPVKANENLLSDYFFLTPFTTEKSPYVPLNRTKETEDYIKHWTDIVKADQMKKQASNNKPVDVPDEPYMNKQQDLSINNDVNNFKYPVEHFTVKEPVYLDTTQTSSQLPQTPVPNVKIPSYNLDKVNNFKFPLERFSENEPVTINKTDRFLQLVPPPDSVALLPPNFGDVHVSKYPLRRISLTKPAGTDIMERFFQKAPSPVNMDDTMELTTVQTKAIMTNNVPDSVQKSGKFTEPVRSKFVYKNVFQSEPHKNTIFEFDNKQKSADGERESSIKTPLEPVKANENLSSDYFFLPPFSTEKPPYVPLNRTKETEDYIKHWTDIVKADQTKKQALNNKPVDVPDEPYTNKQQDLLINNDVNNFKYPVEHFTVKEPVYLDTTQTFSQLTETPVPNVKIPYYNLDKVNKFKYPVERFSENEPITINKTDRFLQFVPPPESIALLPPNFGDVHVSKYPLRRISLTKAAGTDTTERFLQKESSVNTDDTMELTTVQTKVIMTNNVTDSLQKSVKFTDPVRSKFVYKNVFQSEPHKNTIFEFDNEQKSADGEKESSIKTPLEPVKANENLPSDYFFLPPFTTEKSPYVPLNMTKETQDYIKHWTDIVKADQLKKQALNNKPVHVPDEPYTNKQQDLTINKFPLNENHRGDIPEHSAS